MALAEPGACDADELRVLHLLDRGGAAVAHRLAQPADELVEDVCDRTFVRHAPLDALGNELVDVLYVALEVAVLGESARLHRAERTHAAVLLEAFAARQDDVAGSLVRAGEQPARHHRVGAGGDRLRDVPGGTEPAVADHRDAVRLGGPSTLVDRRHLRHADAGDDTGGADGPRSNPDLDRVRAGVDQRLGRLGRGDVPGDHLAVPLPLEAPHHLDHVARVPVGRVDDEDIRPGLGERGSPVIGVRSDTDRGTHAQPSLLVLRRAGELDLLTDVLDGDQAFEAPVGVDDRQLFDLVAVQDRPRLLEGRSDRSGDEIAVRHQGREGLVDTVVTEAEVAVGEDPNQPFFLVRDRDARDVVPRHQLERGGNRGVGRQRHRLDDHSGLGALDLVDLCDLLLDREVAVQDAETALARERDRESRLRHGVHRGGDDGDLERDLPRQARRGRNLVRQHGRIGRHQEDVVEGQPLARELAVELDEALDRLRREVNGQLAGDGSTGPRRRKRAITR